MPDATTQTPNPCVVDKCECEAPCTVDYCVYESDEEEEEPKLKQIGWRPQTRIGECEGCKMRCEECERLVIVEEESDDEDQDSDDEDTESEAVGVLEITIYGKKYLYEYLYDPEENEIFDWLKFMETGEAEAIGILADCSWKQTYISDDRGGFPRNERFIHYDDLMVHISDKETKTYYTKDEFFGDGHYATDTNEDNYEAINKWTACRLGEMAESDDEEEEYREPTEFVPFTHKGKQYYKGDNGACIWVFDDDLNEIGIYNTDDDIELYEDYEDA